MASNPRIGLTAAKYLALEQAAETKSEFYQGEMFAMSGASRKHSRIQADLTAEAVIQLRPRTGCEVFSADTRIKAPATGLYTYPDLSIVCGEPRFEDDVFDTLLNPVVIFEILSPSTEAYDRGEKFRHYRSIPSLREYVLLAQDRVVIDHYTRGDDGDIWQLRTYTDRGGGLHLPSVNITLSIANIYLRIPDPDAHSQAGI